VKAVILAGEVDTRLQSYTTFLPKPMLSLDEKLILEHVISWTEKSGIKSFVLCVNYIRKTIKDYFEDDVIIKKAMNRKKLVSGFITKKGFTDIDNKESYKKHIKNIFKNKTRTEK